MAGLKQLKRRLQSVKNTKKITYAMKLVAAAKLRKAQESVAGFSSYSEKLCNTAKLVEKASEEKSKASDSEVALGSELLVSRPIKKGVILVFGGFRGLAGPYNTNVSRELESSLADLTSSNEGAEFELIVFGKKALEFAKSKGYTVKAEYPKLSDRVGEWPLIDVANALVEDFKAENIDSVHMVYTHFKSVLKQTPKTEVILPLSVDAIAERYSGKDSKSEEEENLKSPILYPSIEELKATIFPRLFSSQLKYAALNSLASEHGSRMTAMDSSTKNAGELIDKLQLTYNKLRQSSITAELLDIIGGAQAVN